MCCFITILISQFYLIESINIEAKTVISCARVSVSMCVPCRVQERSVAEDQLLRHVWARGRRRGRVRSRVRREFARELPRAQRVPRASARRASRRHDPRGRREGPPNAMIKHSLKRMTNEETSRPFPRLLPNDSTLQGISF